MRSRQLNKKIEKNNDHISNAIQQWQREKPDLESHEMLLIGRLINCTILITNELEKLYHSHNINRGEFDVLATLRRSGKPYELTPTELFSTLMITSGTMTNRLQQLKKKGFIYRTENPEDARSLKVVLSNKGLKLIDQLIYQHVELEKKLYQLIPQETKRALENHLGDWLQGLRMQEMQP